MCLPYVFKGQRSHSDGYQLGGAGNKRKVGSMFCKDSPTFEGESLGVYNGYYKVCVCIEILIELLTIP